MNLSPDGCKYYKFYSEYIPLKELAILNIEGIKTIYDYEMMLNSSARSSMRTCRKLGYSSRLIHWSERSKYLEDITEINTSTPSRQGRPMSEGYMEKAKAYTSDFECKTHYPRLYGCFKAGKLYAYAIYYPMGEVAILTTIIGHFYYLKDRIMMNLFEPMILDAIKSHKVFVYGEWNHGTDGLRHWKHSMGFKKGVIW